MFGRKELHSWRKVRYILGNNNLKLKYVNDKKGYMKHRSISLR